MKFDMEAKEETLLEIVCSELGVDVGEEWTGNDGKTYIINKMGSVFEKGNPMLVEVTQSNWKRIMTGELKPAWKPKYGEVYFYPTPLYKETHRSAYWGDSEEDFRLLKRGLVFKEELQAIKFSSKIVELAWAEQKEEQHGNR